MKQINTLRKWRGQKKCDIDLQTATKISRDSILQRYKAALGEIYGGLLERVMLFERAGGDVRPDSDYNVAIFLKSLPDQLA